MGDGLLAEFPSVVDAFSWAVDMQTAAVELEIDWSGSQRIEYRVGVNLGDIIVDGDDIFGDGLTSPPACRRLPNRAGCAFPAKCMTR